MKKSLCLALVLMGAALFSVPLAFAWVDSGRENILITEEILYGNPAEASGIILKIPSHWGRRLLWNTEYHIGSGKEAESSFSFSSEEVSWASQARIDASLQTAGGAGFGMAYAEGYTEQEIPDLGNEVYQDIFEQIKERTGKGEKYTETVRLADYTPVHPLTFEIEGQSISYQGDFNAVKVFLTEYFGVSSAEDRIEATVEKDGEGRIVSFQCRPVLSDDSIIISGAAADGGEGIYYVYDLVNAETGECVDRGQNRGIFYFPYEKREGGSLWNMDLTQVRKVCVYPEGAIPIQMLVCREEGMLCLAVMEKEGYSLFLYSLDGEIPVPLQQIPIGRNHFSGNAAHLQERKNSGFVPEGDAENGGGTESSGGTWHSGSSAGGWGQMSTAGKEEVGLPYFCRISMEDGGILATWSDNSFSFAAGGNGEYRLWCDGIFPDAGKADFYDECAFPKENVCIFDGERLVLAAYESWYRLNVVTAVYHEDGLVYAGRYLHSLEGDMDAGGGGSYFDYQNSIVPQGIRLQMPHYWWIYEGGSGRAETVEPLEMFYE